MTDHFSNTEEPMREDTSGNAYGVAVGFIFGFWAGALLIYTGVRLGFVH